MVQFYVGSARSNINGVPIAIPSPLFLLLKLFYLLFFLSSLFEAGNTLIKLLLERKIIQIFHPNVVEF